MFDTMDLTGGLLAYYNMFGDPNKVRYRDGEPPHGRKVIFLNKNGYDSERELANKFFKEGDILTVYEIIVGRSSSDVEFVEHRGKIFNTVMFADVD